MGYTEAHKKDGSKIVRPTGKGAGSTFVNLGKDSARAGIQDASTYALPNPYITDTDAPEVDLDATYERFQDQYAYEDAIAAAEAADLAPAAQAGKTTLENIQQEWDAKYPVTYERRAESKLYAIGHGRQYNDLINGRNTDISDAVQKIHDLANQQGVSNLTPEELETLAADMKAIPTSVSELKTRLAEQDTAMKETFQAKIDVLRDRVQNAPANFERGAYDYQQPEGSADGSDVSYRPSQRTIDTQRIENYQRMLEKETYTNHDIGDIDVNKHQKLVAEYTETLLAKKLATRVYEGKLLPTTETKQAKTLEHLFDAKLQHIQRNIITESTNTRKSELATNWLKKP